MDKEITLVLKESQAKHIATAIDSIIEIYCPTEDYEALLKLKEYLEENISHDL